MCFATRNGEMEFIPTTPCRDQQCQSMLLLQIGKVKSRFHSFCEGDGCLKGGEGEICFALF